jgi:hypothetical protein
MSSYGALDTETSVYVLPARASKGRSYKCADCNQRVILRQGNVRIHHFSHFTPTTRCNFYENAGESESHKHAKLLMSNWLREKRSITFSWQCQAQTYSGTCGTYQSGCTEHAIEYKDGDEVIIEYRDLDRKYTADVAVLNGGSVRYIIEIKHSHQTTTNVRPEPWFEVNTKDDEFHDESDAKDFENCRMNEKRYCSNCQVKTEKWVNMIPILPKKYGVERRWKQDMKCISCERTSYTPEWINQIPRQVCKPCLGNQPVKVRELVDKLIWS